MSGVIGGNRQEGPQARRTVIKADLNRITNARTLPPAWSAARRFADRRETICQRHRAPNEEIKRRTHAVRIFPTPKPLTADPGALETHETWLEAHRHLNMKDLREHKEAALPMGRDAPIQRPVDPAAVAHEGPPPPP